MVFTRTSAYHIASPLSYEAAMQQKHPQVKVVLANREGAHRKILTRLLKNKKVGINGSFMTVDFYNMVKKRYTPKKMVDVSPAFEKARLIKEEVEIEQMRNAIRITKWAMLQIQHDFKEGITERQLATKFDYITRSLGGGRVEGFDTIVCFGKNSALPHHMPDETKLKEGEVILIDAGASVNNYASDLTRTFFFGKHKDPKMEKVYETVKQARINAIHAMKPGAKASDIHKIAEDYINNAEGGIYKGKFIHALGHSLGIEVHDGVGLTPNTDLVLEPGMVITVEPGIYIEGFGGVRIEDDILVTKDGSLIL
ncbi:MAG: M24 family metallopeptidase [Candidatus Micrarchaeota archaeon]|nr:M24 family metallopeptidase [Candidatus Micrarchaeota archaeon]